MNLLTTRYKLIALWPGCPFSIGATFAESFMPKNFMQNWEEYPHLFRKLDWWENREKKDLPKYIKHKEFVFEVLDWDRDFAYCKGRGYIRLADMVPATEDEFKNSLT